MEEYIERSAAVCVANYAIDEHPYDKDPARPETFSDYNSGWNDACDYIQEKLELLPAVFEPKYVENDHIHGYICSRCKRAAVLDCNDKWVLSQFWPACGAKMGGVNDGV